MRSVREKPPHELNSTQKVSVRSVCSVREKTLQRERKNLYEVCKQPNRGNLTYHAPPCGGGVGGGATVLWVRNSALMSSVKSVSSVREKNPQRVSKCSFSHRVHRRTEHTGFHRDIKSTDYTEPNTHQRPHPQPLSEWRGEGTLR